EEVGFEACDRQDPTQLTDKIAALPLRQDLLESLAICESRGRGPASGLGEFLLDRRAWEAWFESADGIHEVWCDSGSVIRSDRRSTGRTGLRRDSSGRAGENPLGGITWCERCRCRSLLRIRSNLFHDPILQRCEAEMVARASSRAQNLKR